MHGDLDPGHVRMTADHGALINWDQSHVDAAGLDEGALDVAAQASAAWEAPVCWDDDHAVKRLAQVRAI